MSRYGLRYLFLSPRQFYCSGFVVLVSEASFIWSFVLLTHRVDDEGEVRKGGRKDSAGKGGLSVVAEEVRHGWL